jgi:hypothetical protein
MNTYRSAAVALTACAASLSLTGLGHKNVTTISIMPK